MTAPDRGADARLAAALAQLPLPSGDLGLEDAVLAYRRSRAVRRHGQRVARGIVSVLSAGAVVMSGGVAVAYAASLPPPVQRAAHHLFGRLGIPAPHRDAAMAEQHRHVTFAQPTERPAVAPRAATAATPASLTALESRVRDGEQAWLVAHAAPHRAVVLITRIGSGWHEAASAETSARGEATFRVRLTHSTVFAVEPRGRVDLRSHSVTVDVVPRLTVAVAGTRTGWDLTVHAVGATAGDRVRVVRIEKGLVAVAAGRLDGQGVVQLVVSRPDRSGRYVVTLEATPRHPAVLLPLFPAPRVRAA